MKFSDNYEIYRDYVFRKKYKAGDESIQDMYDRVTNSIIKKAVDLYGELDENVIELKSKLPELIGTKWIPGGSILSNLGVDTKAMNSLANCTVYFNKDDSYSGISQNEEAIRNLCKRRCGIGQDISHYRPEGSAILNAAVKSTGLTTRMASFSNVLLEVAQNGRRGALMLTCHINHPDILSFITFKSLDLRNCNGANVSVLLTDEFFSAVKSKDKNERWLMKFPIDTELTRDEYDLVMSSGVNTLVELEGGRSAKWNFVSEIWSNFVKCNIKGAEPGAIYIDTVRKSATNVYEGGYVESTNPCFTGDTLIAVADGRVAVPIKQLADEGVTVPIYCYDEDNKLVIQDFEYIRKTGVNKKLTKINIEGGHSLTVTDDHGIYVRDKGMIDAKDLKSGDSLIIFSKVYVDNLTIRHTELRTENGVRNTEFYPISPRKTFKTWINESKFIYHERNKVPYNSDIVHHIDGNPYNNDLSNLKLISKAEHNSIHASQGLWTGDKNGNWGNNSDEDILSWAINKTRDLGHRISKNDVKNAKLSFTFKGRKSPWMKSYKHLADYSAKLVYPDATWHGVSDTRNLRNHVIAEKEGYSMRVINGKSHVVCNCDLCGTEYVSPVTLRNKAKNNSINCCGSNDKEYVNHKVISIEDAGYDDVYCGYVDKYHTLLVGGFQEKTVKRGWNKQVFIKARQCGELPLPIGDSCRLSSVILSAYPDFLTKDYYSEFKVIGFASDLLIDLDVEYSEAILAKVKSQNINGVLDKEEEMWELFIDKALKMRRNGIGFTGLADFFAANEVIYGSPESVALSEELAKKFNEYVSKVSVYLAKCYGSFGIWDLEKEKDVPYIKDCFVHIKGYRSYGRRWVTALTVAPNGSLSILTGTSSGAEPLFAKRYNRVSLGKTFEITHPFVTPENEKYYIEAKEVDALAKVSILSKIQKYWDNSISVTYNLPKGVTESLVSSLYLKSYELGIKGMTIYVDGSRDNIYSDIKSKVTERPEFIECDVHHLNFMGERWVAFIGKLNGQLWEVFLGIEDEDRYLPKSITKGHLRKVNTGTGKSRYDFRFKDKYGYYCYVGGVNHIFKSDLWNYGRLISALMRTNSPAQLYQIVSKLYNESESINSWKSNLLRVIKSYIEEGEVIPTKCTECGGSLVKREGCITCEKCGMQSCN